ncbi:hypothetical protein OHA70_25880 [Kribbella sp. NBC_00382]|uniref:hypothetical protein n=1 Tax=Kribbella sp. NBC_00382 TaxID=2975967 RepID=UPI002E1C279A
MAGRKRDRDPDARRPGQRPLPPEPDSWRSVVNNDYDYPEELDELSRRERRQAKKTWRRDDHAARMAWLRSQRQAEPVSPAAIVVLVIIVMVVILGLGGGLPRILGGGDDKEQPVGLLTPGQPISQPTAPGATSASTSEQPTTTPTQSTPPPETHRPPPTAITGAVKVVETWARVFYTRDPAVESYSQLINKTADYVTPGLAGSFAAAGDSTYDALKASNGRSTVVAAVVSVPRADVAPVDTDTRVTRLVKVTIQTTGTKPQRFDVPLLVTVIAVEGKWLISDVSGGTGP